MGSFLPSTPKNLKQAIAPRVVPFGLPKAIDAKLDKNKTVKAAATGGLSKVSEANKFLDLGSNAKT